MQAQAQIEPRRKLAKDLLTATSTMSPREARYLVDTYYQMQDNRIRAANQVRSMNKDGEPHQTIAWFMGEAENLEEQVKRALHAYAKSQPVGQWLLSIVGIGPVIAAGLLAHIDIEKAPTVGHIWRFAGYDPTTTWGKGEKRPWNASLKTLCWKASESFVKTCNNDKSYYGPIYLQKKVSEIALNEAGAFAEQADNALAQKRFGKDTDAYYWYSGCLSREAAIEYRNSPPEKRQGLTKKLASEPGSGVKMLPPAHIHARSTRYTVKMFLSHLHHRWYVERYGVAPPVPYPIAHMGHAHYIAPPE